ncbi:hypothetical protein B0H17DRAFT_920757, partial [Mycena rosella]
MSTPVATNVAIVDDHDPLVHYTGAWQTAGAPEEFNATTSFSSEAGAAATFSFNGTSVTVFGTIAAKAQPNASLTFLVDSSVSGAYTPPNGMTSDIHHEALWASPALSDGPHTLVITQATAQAAGVIYLDYI